MEFKNITHKDLLEIIKNEANYTLLHPILVQESETRPSSWYSIFAEFFIIFPNLPEEEEPRPTKREVIRQMTVLNYSKNREEYFKSQGIDTTCSICQSKYECKEKLIQIICQHFYHKDCILKWLERSNTCPICRCIIDDDSKVEKMLTRNGVKLYRIGLQLEEIFEELVEVIEKRIGRWWIFNQDISLKRRIWDIERELIFMVREIKKMGILEKIKGIQRDVLLKIIKIEKEIERVLGKFK